MEKQCSCGKKVWLTVAESLHSEAGGQEFRIHFPNALEVNTWKRDLWFYQVDASSRILYSLIHLIKVS